jgi:hypothetical protein
VIKNNNFQIPHHFSGSFASLRVLLICFICLINFSLIGFLFSLYFWILSRLILIFDLLKLMLQVQSICNWKWWFYGYILSPFHLKLIYFIWILYWFKLDFFNEGWKGVQVIEICWNTQAAKIQRQMFYLWLFTCLSK